LAIGAYSDLGALMVDRTIAGATGTYRLPNLKVDSYGVYTNEPITGPLRGFGAPEINWAIEQQMDIIAETLRIDKVELRKKNILNEGEKDAGGMITHSIGAKQCLDKVTEWIGWNEEPVQEEGPWRRGKGVAVGSKSSRSGTSSSVILKVWPDGVIEVRHSGAEVGQGLNTTLAQIVAEEFGVTVGQVKVVTGNTDFCGYDFGTVAQRGLFYNGNALISACQDVKRQLFMMAAVKLEAEPEELMIRDGNICVKSKPERAIGISSLFTRVGLPLQGGDMIGTGSFTTSVIPQDPETGQSERYVPSFSHGATAAEVAVNTETGEVKVARIAGAFDMGNPLNPKIVEGQIEGGVSIGIGTALYEKVILDKGLVINPSFMDYKIPTSTVMPDNKNVKSMMAPVPHRDGPFGAKGVGEVVTVPVAPAIANAVYNAIGVRIKDLPINREKLFDAIKQSQKGS
jgi:CO/xanthine dehydrogenase Mo-binding subunit